MSSLREVLSDLIDKDILVMVYLRGVDRPLWGKIAYVGDDYVEVEQRVTKQRNSDRVTYKIIRRLVPMSAIAYVEVILEEIAYGE